SLKSPSCIIWFISCYFDASIISNMFEHGITNRNLMGVFRGYLNKILRKPQAFRNCIKQPAII
ncbi:MAG: hypothetical protein PHW77_09645, partial [Eubacteriales bacterium]|nr:hypothetical protein [Eubacteriales bacterium]